MYKNESKVTGGGGEIIFGNERFSQINLPSMKETLPTGSEYTGLFDKSSCWKSPGTSKMSLTNQLLLLVASVPFP